MTYQCKYFKAFELVPRKTYESRGEKAIELLDKELLIALDYVREQLGAVTVNTWKSGGQFQYRGLRTPDSKEFSSVSQHSYGKAVDYDVKGMSAEQVRQWLIANRETPELRAISFIEMGVSWVHMDTRPTPENCLICWWPNGRTEILSREV
ncbi:MAG: hypothetical protein ACRCVV_21995 [Shewanella sp.]